MKWYWFCQCGARLDPATETEDFSYCACGVCGCKMMQCIKREVFSFSDKIKAWVGGYKLMAREHMSITQAAETKRFHKEHPFAK
jgi:hypothetical protein